MRTGTAPEEREDWSPLGWFAGVRNCRGLRESRRALKLGIAGSSGFTGLSCAVAAREGEVCRRADDPKPRGPETRRWVQ